MRPEKPILFSGPMVRAILGGRKTQTRRAIMPQPPPQCVSWDQESRLFRTPGSSLGIIRRCPYAVGDLLYVRETWQTYDGHVMYRADFPSAELVWRPSIHMPKWAARIWLEIVGVRAQRVQEITFKDCLVEGILSIDADILSGYTQDWEPPSAEGKEPIVELADDLDSAIRHIYMKVWDSTYPAAPWESNPWVWAYDYKLMEVRR